MVETPAELPVIWDQVVCLSHDQAGPRRVTERAAASDTPPRNPEMEHCTPVSAPALRSPVLVWGIPRQSFCFLDARRDGRSHCFAIGAQPYRKAAVRITTSYGRYLSR